MAAEQIAQHLRELKAGDTIYATSVMHKAEWKIVLTERPQAEGLHGKAEYIRDEFGDWIGAIVQDECYFPYRWFNFCFRRPAVPPSEPEQDTIKRDSNERLNKQAMLRIMRDFGITIRPRDLPNWRPTKREIGSIPGVRENLTIVATDGLLGYFYDSSGSAADEKQSLLFGHITHFTGDVAPLYGSDKAATPKTPKETKATREMRELLAQLQK